MGKHLLSTAFRSRWFAIIIFAIAAGVAGLAQDADPRPSSQLNSASSTDPSAPSVKAVEPVQPSSNGKPTRVESSIFSSLFMTGKTQDQFEPLTAKKRVGVYARDLLSPFHFALAGISAGITQAQNSPKEWGQGAAGYGTRFGNFYLETLVANMLQMGGEDILHEDNIYYGSGESGLGSRAAYAIKSSVLARGRDGTQHFSISQISSTAAASFISRLWQPASHASARDGAVNFGISLATNAGVNVVREFLPGFTRHIFRRGSAKQRSAVSSNCMRRSSSLSVPWVRSRFTAAAAV